MYLVLGGNGFIGQHLVKKLLEKGKKVRVFDGCTDKIEEKYPEVECIKGDFRYFCYDDILDGVETVYHCISTTIACDGTMNAYVELTDNVIPTINLLEAMVKKNTKRIIFCSSGGTVYGNYEGIASEKNRLEPISTHGLQKVIIEKYLWIYQYYHNIESFSIRIANPYGTGQNPNKQQGVIPIFINKIFNNEEIVIWGDGTVLRDYIHIDDVIDALIALVDYHGHERVFNIGTGRSYSLNQIIGLISEELHKKPVIVYKAPRKCDVFRTMLDTTLVNKELNWKAKIDLPDGIKMLASRLEY